MSKNNSTIEDLLVKRGYEAIIGLEMHVQLDTTSKMFSSDSNADTLEPNIHVNPVSLGHPGTLPVLNRDAIDKAIMAGLALNCDIASICKFDRKHYFYPDLPKGYQISQYDEPICSDGELAVYPNNIDAEVIEIERIHMEEDSAKNIHTDSATLVDFNRAGSPLIEIVTKPTIRSAKAARTFLQELQLLMRTLGVSEADMEKGHMRVDANISLRPVGEDALFPKTEVKNLNSFKAVERALLHEMERQLDLWDADSAPEITETRGWDEQNQATVVQRIKEDAADYRYFPEPDIPPLNIDRGWVNSLVSKMPELPIAKRERFMQEYALSYADARTVTSDAEVAEYFERAISELRAWLNSLDDVDGSDEQIWAQYGKKMSKLLFNWLTSELFGQLSKKGLSFSDVQITPENFAELITLLYARRVNSSAAQNILTQMIETNADPSQIMEEQNLTQEHNEDIVEQYITEVLNEFPKEVEEVQNGRDRVMMFLVGQVMKRTKGKADPQAVTDALRAAIDKLS